MEEQIKGEFKHYMKHAFGLSDEEYRTLLRKIKNRSVNSVIFKLVRAPYSFEVKNSEFKKYIKTRSEWLAAQPKVSAVIDAPDTLLTQKQRLTPEEIKYIFLKEPELFDADLYGHNNNSPVAKVKYNLFFYTKILGLDIEQILIFTEEIPGFLTKNLYSKDQFSVINQLQFFCEAWHIDITEMGKLLQANLKFARMIFNGTDNLQVKTQKLIEVGFSKDVVKEHLELYKVNPNRLKFQYMVQRMAFGVQRKMPSYIPYPSSLTHSSDQLVFARAMYLKSMNNKRLRCKYLYGSAKYFYDVTETLDADLLSKYPLTRETLKDFETTYNYKNPCKLTLDENEIAEVTSVEAQKE